MTRTLNSSAQTGADRSPHRGIPSTQALEPKPGEFRIPCLASEVQGGKPARAGPNKGSVHRLTVEGGAKADGKGGGQRLWVQLVADRGSECSPLRSASCV